MKSAVSVQMGQNVEIRKNGILVQRAKNLVVTAGREWIAERMISAVPAVMSHMAIGLASGFSANLCVNGDCELDANWNDYGTPTSQTRSAVQAHAGSAFSRAIVTPGGGYDGTVSDDFTTVTGQDIFVQAWIYPTAGNSCYVAVRQGDDERYLYYTRWSGLTPGMWNKIDFSIVELSGGIASHIAFFNDVADTIYIDNVSVNNSVLLTETTLTTELSRLPLVGAVRTNNYIEYTCLWAASIGTGAITEAGIFNDPAAGTMLSRIAFPVINKLIDDSLAINWKCYITSV